MSNDWAVYDYELSMFEATFELCISGSLSDFRHPIPNSVVESLLLHTRILVDILLSRDPEPDAVSLKKLLSDFTPAANAPLVEAYGTAKQVDSPCWTINKRLAHATRIRTDFHDYTPMLLALRPAMISVIHEVHTERFRRESADMHGAQPAAEPAPEP
jgi:hypothetical protein